MIIFALLLAGCSQSGRGGQEYQFAEDAKDGGYVLPAPSPGQYQATKEPSYFTIQVNASPTVSSTGKRCNLMIGNPAENEQYVKVKLILDATGEELFFSELLKPGERNAYVDLSLVPEAGEHTTTAVFMVYDPESMEQLSEIDAGVLLTVQK
jgi:hypothetical protein